MDVDSMPLTIGLGVILVAVFLGGGGAVWWISSRFNDADDAAEAAVENAKSTLLDAIAKSREDGDRRLDVVAAKIDGVAARQAAHELDVEKRFVTKDSAAGSYHRIETAVGELREDVRGLVSRITSRRQPPHQG